MGLCPSLSELQTARPGAALLHAPLQLASTSCQYRTNAAHLQTRPDRGQPVETPHLEHLPLGWNSRAEGRALESLESRAALAARPRRGVAQVGEGGLSAAGLVRHL